MASTIFCDVNISERAVCCVTAVIQGQVQLFRELG